MVFLEMLQGGYDFYTLLRDVGLDYPSRNQALLVISYLNIT
jgi:hypothetical protein